MGVVQGMEMKEREKELLHLPKVHIRDEGGFVASI